MEGSRWMTLKHSLTIDVKFSTLFKELRDLSEPIKKSLESSNTKSAQRHSASKQRSSYSPLPLNRIRRSVRIRRSTRLKQEDDADYRCDSEDESEDDSDYDYDDENYDPKNRLVVCFPSQVKYRVDVNRNEVIDVWEGEEDEDLDKEHSQERRVVKRVTDMAIVLPPEEITEEHLRNVAQKTGGKTYSSERGTCCHQCRQKTLDTKTMCRSGNCIGVRGQFCGPCLKNRYGESAEKALKDPDWACPPCRGLCNCSICRTRKGKKPTGILVPFVKSEGYDNVKEYLQFEED
ncbi:cell division cycle-associated protein 7-like isoform X2 [Periplaneta americana]|uniref:cell division cycle-associated protein 7-like isoform X2 n=1 Tax=Periplaneta americana TaxID=6978 RepID=UPI0037E8B285